MTDYFEKIGFVTAIILPFFNIPLIVKMIKRKSSVDISMAWCVGVWICTMLMFPSGLLSKDIVWRTYCIINSILFSAVFVTVIKYRKGKINV